MIYLGEKERDGKQDEVSGVDIIGKLRSVTLSFFNLIDLVLSFERNPTADLESPYHLEQQ